MVRYIEVKFRPEDKRAYTYQCSDPDMALAVGDQVEVDARGSLKIVEVVGISEKKPPYATKPILKRIPKEPSDERKAALKAGDAAKTPDEEAWLAKANEEAPNDSLADL